MIVLFVLAVLIFVAAIVAMLSAKKITQPVLRSLLPILLLIVSVAFAVISCIRTVPTGHTGIVTTFPLFLMRLKLPLLVVLRLPKGGTIRRGYSPQVSKDCALQNRSKFPQKLRCQSLSQMLFSLP